MNRMVRVVLLAIAVSTSACVSLVRGSMDEVKITTKIPGAVLTVDDHPTPFGAVELERAHSHMVHVTAPGYLGRDLLITRTIRGVWFGVELAESFFAGISAGVLILPVAIDLSNGAECDLFPREMNVELEPRLVSLGSTKTIPSDANSSRPVYIHPKDEPGVILVTPSGKGQ